MSLNFFDQNILNYSQNPIQLFYHKIYNNNLTDITFRHSNRRFRVIANDFPTLSKTFPDQTKKIQQKKNLCTKTRKHFRKKYTIESEKRNICVHAQRASTSIRYFVWLFRRDNWTSWCALIAPPVSSAEIIPRQQYGLLCIITIYPNGIRLIQWPLDRYRDDSSALARLLRCRSPFSKGFCCAVEDK